MIDIEEGQRLLAEAKKNDHAPGDEYGAPPAVLKLGNWAVNNLPALLAIARSERKLRRKLVREQARKLLYKEELRDFYITDYIGYGDPGEAADRYLATLHHPEPGE